MPSSKSTVLPSIRSRIAPRMMVAWPRSLWSEESTRKIASTGPSPRASVMVLVRPTVNVPVQRLARVMWSRRVAGMGVTLSS